MAPASTEQRPQISVKVKFLEKQYNDAQAQIRDIVRATTSLTRMCSLTSIYTSSTMHQKRRLNLQTQELVPLPSEVTGKKQPSQGPPPAALVQGDAEARRLQAV